ncbi:hypothetical protein [Sulfurimonas sp.]|uniref:hypothetical protein n=1 Tax=Sulfurimonas sp. TaxID=2022749 RepID=UPI002601A87F|nr:hypothetical protein [Sulfurimonas sp.]
MEYPEYFSSIESIRLYDDLSQFLGVNKDGLVEISYLDIVKTAGHSCATVAGAYIVALKGLEALYPDELPVRGKIKVEIQKAPRVENAGVVGSVLSNITGATKDYGFGGIPTGKFNRRDLLFFEADISCDVRLTRLDTQEKVAINYKPQKIVNPMAILKSAIVPNATAEDKESFPRRFQEMVQTVFENIDEVLEIRKEL